MKKKSKMEKMMEAVECKFEITIQRNGICFMQRTPAIMNRPPGNWAEPELFEFQKKDMTEKLNELLELNFENMDTKSMISLGPVDKLIIIVWKKGAGCGR